MTRRSRWAVRLGVALALHLVVVPMAYAECEELAPFCQRVSDYDVIFEGTISRVESIMREGATYELREGNVVSVTKPAPHRLITFAVRQAWAGVSASEVEIVEPGIDDLRGRWLVLARRNADGTLSAVWCGATRRYEEAAEELAYLRALDVPADGARVFGHVYLRDRLHPAAAGRSEFMPVVTRLTLNGGGVQRTSTPSDEGRFEFDRLAPGSYTLAIDAPPATKGYDGPMPVRLASGRACARLDLLLEPASRISGEVVVPLEAQAVKVELLAADTWRTPGAAARDAFVSKGGSGAFEFEGVSPGRYVLVARVIDAKSSIIGSSLMTAFRGPTGNDDTTIVVGAEEHVRVPPLSFPTAEAVTTGQVELRWSDGTPIARSYVRFEDASDTFLPSRFRASYSHLTDAAGRTGMTGVPGRLYIVSVLPMPGTPRSATEQVSASEPFVMREGKQPVVLTLPLP